MSELTIYCAKGEPLDLSRDYFAAFALPLDCDVDNQLLAERYRKLQQAVHPDRFLRECDRSQRLAQQQAAYVNEAYSTLKNPLLRAQYLLHLAGQERAQEATVSDPVFLMAQIELRERLDEVRQNLAALDDMYDEVVAQKQRYWEDFAEHWRKQDWTGAQRAVDRLQFAVKLLHEIEERQAALED